MNTPLEHFLETHMFPGDLLLAKVWGSHSHNTETPSSDWDFSGVYVVPTREMLGLTPPAEVTNSKEGAEKPDYAFYEVGKFCNLLLTGNPGIVEMLFTDRMYIDSDAWESLRKERHRFLTKKAVSQYIGYAEGQLKRLKAHQGLHTKGSLFSEKWAYHLVRLLGDAYRIATGGEPVVWKEGDERNYLMRIRNYEYSQEDIEHIAEDGIGKIRGVNMVIPEVGDREFLEKWLIDLRINKLSG